VAYTADLSPVKAYTADLSPVKAYTADLSPVKAYTADLSPVKPVQRFVQVWHVCAVAASLAYAQRSQQHTTISLRATVYAEHHLQVFCHACNVSVHA
jgi:hypothetical protein